MAKRQRSQVLKRLAGKRLFFSGKFDYGTEDSLKALAQAQQGIVCKDINDKVDYLVLADLNAGKMIQKKAATLNAKGATIQTLDVDGFMDLAGPTNDELLALLRAGDSETFARIREPIFYQSASQTPKYAFHSEDFGSVHLERVHLDSIHFDHCRFVGAKFNDVHIEAATECDFSKVAGEDVEFGSVLRSRFNKANLDNAEFSGDFSGADFTGASLQEASFTDGVHYLYGRSKKATPTDVLFAKANLREARFDSLQLKSPDFSRADLTKACFNDCSIDSGNFRQATLRETVLVGCKLANADLTGADLTGANLSGADLKRATLAGANLKNANLRGAKLDGVDLSKVKNYDPGAAASGVVGPALRELDQVSAKAGRIQVTFYVRPSAAEDGEEVSIDTSRFQWGWGVHGPQSVSPQRIVPRGSRLAFSDAMMHLANVAGHMQVRFDAVSVSSTKSPTGGKELRDLVMKGISEAFAQEMPPEEELAAATKAYRTAEREKGAAERKRRERAKAQLAKQKEQAKQQIAEKVEKAVGKVSDVASFLKALEVRIEKPKIDKATKMLKASGFKLFNDVTDDHVSGVVKSQTDPDLVYACRVAHDGQYACCTQNLNICGGLRGSICKHLLVLIIGLVQAGELDPTTIDAWIAKTHSVKPELDKEAMGEIFLKYKGAEAGEVDWRPTETVPEDYYAL